MNIKTILTFVFAVLLLAVSCNEKEVSNQPLTSNEILRSKILHSGQLASLGIAQTSLDANVLVNDMPDGSKRVLAKFINDDLKFIIAKFDKAGSLVTTSYVEVMPENQSIKNYQEASNNFEAGTFTGTIVIRPYLKENIQLEIENSKQINADKVNNARGCGLGQALYDIGGMGLGSKVFCFIGFIGCLAANYLDCVLE